MRYKKTAATLAIATSFFLGVMFSGPIKDTRKYFHYEAAEGFYAKPYNLKIEKRKNIEGKIETYLVDEETKQYKKIRPNLIKERNQRFSKALDLAERVYEFFFD